MAIYTNFFVASKPDIQAAFPGWKLPLETPIRREAQNPFTKQAIMAWSWDPDPASPSQSVVPARHVVEIKGDYQAYLEARSHPIVQGHPHHCWKSVDSMKIQSLYELLSPPNTPPPSHGFAPAVIPPPNANCYIEVLPGDFSRALSALSPDRLISISESWAKTEELVSDRFSDQDALMLCTCIRDLANAALSTEKNLYLMTEW